MDHDWTELIVTVPVAQVDRAGDIAQMVVPYGIYIEDYSHLEQEAWEIARIDLIDQELLEKDRTVGLVHVYISPQENPGENIRRVLFLCGGLWYDGTGCGTRRRVCAPRRNGQIRFWPFQKCERNKAGATGR